jgi:methyl-accepting chemotaxis protein
MFVLAHMQSSLKEMLRAIFINANKVQASVERLSAESNAINLATQVQAGAVRYTRAAIAEVSASVEVVNGLVHATEEGANEVARRAHDGAHVAAEVAVEMQAIADTVAVSSEQVSRLVASTGEIGTHGQGDQGNRRPDQPAGAQCGDRGRARRRTGSRLRGRGRRGPQAGRANQQGDKRDRRASCRAYEPIPKVPSTGMQAAAPVIASGVTQANSAADTLRAIEEQAQDTLQKMNALSQATREQTHRIEDIVGHVDEVMTASGTDRECDQTVAAIGSRPGAGVQRDVLDGTALQYRRTGQPWTTSGGSGLRLRSSR